METDYNEFEMNFQKTNFEEKLKDFDSMKLEQLDCDKRAIG